MKPHSKKIMMIAALLPIAMFFTPIWRITLEAPQYPNGITMYIWINQITGDAPATLQNINILNHYVGMQYIVPESIPELKFFPYIVIGMIVLALIFTFVGNRKLYLTWGVLFVLLGVAGLYDFYLWEYDYGHTLDPKAPIKVPGMAYQPPVFGSKMLLNFNAISYPYWGGFFLGLSIALSVIAFFTSKEKNVYK